MRWFARAALRLQLLISAEHFAEDEEPATKVSQGKIKKNGECRRRLRECFVCPAGQAAAFNWSVTLLGIINNCVEKKKKKKLECSWSHYGIKAIPLSPRLASG